MRIMIPAIRLERASLRAKPRAKPVSPKPATRADTFIPSVPSIVTKPKISRIILIALPIKFKNFLSISVFLPNLKTNFCRAIPPTQNAIKIKRLPAILGAKIDI